MSVDRPRRAVVAAAATVLALAALGAVAPAARAQAVHPFSFGLSAGGAFLTGNDRDSWRDGFAAQGTLALGFPVLPVQLRADLGYQTFQGRATGTGPTATGVGDLTVWSGTLSLVARSTGSWGIVRPYLAAGGGVYRTGVDDIVAGQTRHENKTGGGLTGALGVTVPVAGINAFFEGRLHSFSLEGNSLRTYPVVAGFMF